MLTASARGGCPCGDAIGGGAIGGGAMGGGAIGGGAPPGERGIYPPIAACRAAAYGLGAGADEKEGAEAGGADEKEGAEAGPPGEPPLPPGEAGIADAEYVGAGVRVTPACAAD